MDVRLSPEQVDLKETARKLAQTWGPRNVSDLDDTERAAKLDAAVSSSGWRELRLPDDESGAPLASGVEAALVAEELARSLADTSYLGPLVAGDLARRAGHVEVEGTTVALTANLADLAGRAGAVATDDVIAVDTAGSTAALVLEPASDGYTLGRVPLDSAVVRLDLTRPIASVRCTPEPLGGTTSLSEDDVVAWQALALAVLSADLVGVMRGAVELARDYALVREQYGTTIGAFQAVQHLIADAHVAAEGAYSLALHAAWAVDALPPDEALLAARHAKAYTSRAARTVCETAIQVHGGIGNTWECLAHVYLRRALHSSEILGGAGASLAFVLARHGLKAGDDGLR
ncbi:acyl-CoA dehydrogenase family protein [Mumia sp. DW29H23]|uniref:acyl-CoA dehydrogenase family protein n=1 Tax=Mumia sp. DW29H23 TaxID=3421241 RepID=UPI003D699CA9